MKVYSGRRVESGLTLVSVEEAGRVRPLSLRLDLANHSPTGFEWGYGGSGPAQLALALCADAAGDARALDVYQDFKARVVVKLPGAWTLGWDAVVAAVEEVEAARRGGGAP